MTSNESKKHRSNDSDALYGSVQPSSKKAAKSSAAEDSKPRHHRAWSLHESSSLLPNKSGSPTHENAAKRRKSPQSGESSSSKGGILYYLIYAMVNIIISVPGLYGYAAVIFNHPVFQPHMNALSKLVLFSSMMHQLGFTLFSSLPFAIGTVQDAGLIFLSSMSNRIAHIILAKEDGTEEQVLSTTLVLLSGGTALLGGVLIIMGRFRLADAVSYLPMPVVGGYLAFIGYFCLEAGVALCISKAMTGLADWKYLLDGENVILAVPGLAAGLLLTLISRKASNDAALPMAMIAIPAIFYVCIYATGVGLEGARQGKWVGEEAPPVPVSELFRLVDFRQVHWSLVSEILFTWVGMVFVVSFASCLDVAAISMDMGEALDTNRELTTVGICNCMSGLTLGFTGSYIFSQTIFTYRTGVHSRWIGIIIMAIFMYVIASPVNILQVAPLFFLGSTLIFIGYDLLYEWLFEIRHKIFLSEYIIVWATFVAIQFVGMDAGIVIGVIVSLAEHVVVSAHATGVNRVIKKSRAIWSPEEHRILQNQGYHPTAPRILTLEVIGTVFFGSSLLLLQRLTDEVGIDLQQDEAAAQASTLLRSPHTPSHILMKERQTSGSAAAKKSTVLRRPPKFVVLDLSQLSNLDASASRGCFLQFAKLAAKKGIVVCAASPSPRIDWMLRSHDVAYEIHEENKMKALFQARLGSKSPDRQHSFPSSPPEIDRILLFLTTYEALEFCEASLLQQMNIPSSGPPFGGISSLLTRRESFSLSSVFETFLGCSIEDSNILRRLDGQRYHDEVAYELGEEVFDTNTHAEAFFIVLKGAVAVAVDQDNASRSVFRQKQTILSGAGMVRQQGSSSNLLDPLLSSESMVVRSMWPVGGIFGYVDFLLQRPRVYRAVATHAHTVCARISHSQMNLLQNEDPILDALIQRVLLHASILDLANCTCDE